jgi:ribonuclease-3
VSISKFTNFFHSLYRLIHRPKQAARYAALERAIGHTFKNYEFLETALTHPRVKCSRHTAHLEDYQRLEFLGDAVLGLVLAESLFTDTDGDEGFLTNARTRIVCGRNLAAAGKRLRLGELMRLPETADSPRLRNGDTANEDMVEALFGAVFLDGGLAAARTLATHIFDGDPIDWCSPEEVEQSRSAKCKLQEFVQRDGRPNDGNRIIYNTAGTIGPSSARKFKIEVFVDGHLVGEGTGKTKRNASEAAAAAALQKLTAKKDAHD